MRGGKASFCRISNGCRGWCRHDRAGASIGHYGQGISGVPIFASDWSTYCIPPFLRPSCPFLLQLNESVNPIKSSCIPWR